MFGVSAGRCTDLHDNISESFRRVPIPLAELIGEGKLRLRVDWKPTSANLNRRSGRRTRGAPKFILGWFHQKGKQTF
jgi:hypothetical protein